jgi:hypothetical protein
MGGNTLKPMVIFKGTAEGKIATKELKTFSDECVWAAQPKAWCDERCMLIWVKECLKPWKEALIATHGPMVPVLILDAFRVHMMVGGALENWPNFQTPLLLMKLWDLLQNMCVRVDLKFEQKIPSGSASSSSKTR